MFKPGSQLPGTVLLYVVFAVAGASAQSVTGVEPKTCKAGDTITVKGENLRARSLKGVLLFRDGEYYPVKIVKKEDANITMTVPQVPPGEYRFALKVDDSTYVEAVGVTVE